MADFVTLSHAEIERRRRALRRQRRWRIVKTLWRSLVVTGLAGGVVWVVSLPGWVIRNSTQIQIEGNEFLSTETIQSLLPISYPQSLLTLRPQAIAKDLQAQGPIANVVIDRQLFPPSLTVHIQEQHPVAILVGNTYVGDRYYGSTDAQPVLDDPRFSTQSSAIAPTGLIDENGVWMPLERYMAVHQDLDLPDLTIIGMRHQYRPYWSTLYNAIKTSPVKVYEIDWRDSANLIINTEVGIVYLGSYESSKFIHQLRYLDRARYLSQQIPADDINYIDLRNPADPFLQLSGTATVPITTADSEQESSLAEPDELNGALE